LEAHSRARFTVSRVLPTTPISSRKSPDDWLTISHDESGFKVDVFVLTRDSLARTEMDRRELIAIGEGVSAYFATAEDTVLQKLVWYQKGARISERQWNDVLGVLKVQRGRLDQEYLDRCASILGVAELLARAREEAK
jgi:hypothetical protein